MGASTHTTAIANKTSIWDTATLFTNGGNKLSQATFMPVVNYQIIHEFGQI